MDEQQFGFDETARAEAALSEAENAPENAAAAITEPAPEKRNYEKYLEGQTGPQAEPFDMPQFMPGGFEAEQGNTGEFNNVGNIPRPQVPPNPYFNPENGGYNEYSVPPAGNSGYDSSRAIEGLEEPVSMGEWFICLLLSMIPCVNIVMMFVWAFSKNEKKSKSNYFKVQLIAIGVVLAVYIVIAMIAIAAGIGMASVFR